MALWDLKGKFLDLPLYQLLGGKTHDKLRAYASTLFADTPDETAARGAALVDQGYTAVKFGWGCVNETIFAIKSSNGGSYRRRLHNCGSSCLYPSSV